MSKQESGKNSRGSISRFIVTLIILFMFMAGATLLMKYFNFGPFQSNHEPGIPNGYVKELEQETGAVGFFVDANGGLAFNVDSSKITVKLDYYNGKDLIKSVEVLNLESESSHMQSGKLYWCYTEKDGLPEMFKVNLISNEAGATGEYDFKDVNFKKEDLGSRSTMMASALLKQDWTNIISENIYQLALGEPVPLIKLVNGDSISDSVFPVDGAEVQFKRLIIYVIFDK